MQPIIADYSKHLKNDSYSDKTIKNRQSSIKTLLERLQPDIQNLNFNDLEDYFYQRRQELKESSYQLERGNLRIFFKYCQEVRAMKLQFNYENIRRRKVESDVKFITREQVELAILKMNNPQDRLMTAVLFESGMRISELVNLRVEHIHLTELRVKGKGNKSRLVLISEELARSLQSHIREQGIMSGPVFQRLQLHSNNSREVYATDTVRKRIKRAFSAIGVEMHPHMLRHGFGTDMLRNKADIRTIQELMGHKYVTTTQIYTHVTNQHLQEAYAKCFKRSVITPRGSMPEAGQY